MIVCSWHIVKNKKGSILQRVYNLIMNLEYTSKNEALISLVRSHIDSIHPHGEKGISTLWASSQSSIAWLKNSRQVPAEGHPAQCLTRTSQTHQGHRKHSKSAELSELKGAQRDLISKCNVISWIKSLEQKKYLE